MTSGESGRPAPKESGSLCTGICIRLAVRAGQERLELA